MKKIFTQLVLLILKHAAIIQLKKNHPLIIGVTGSAGKSSTVLAIFEVLKKDFRVLATKKGNSETGIPMEILGIKVKNYQGLEWIGVIFQSLWQLMTTKPNYQILIAEMGIDSDQPPKNMDYLLSFLNPQIGVLLNVSAVHSANFGPSSNPIQTVTNEKSKLLSSLPEGGLAIFSLDYPQITNVIKNIKAQIATVSNHNNDSASIFLTNYAVSQSGTDFKFFFNGKTYELQFKNQLHIKNSFSTFATSLIIVDHFGLDIKKSISNLEKNYRLPPGRMNIFKGINDSTIIDSSYNSSLEPTTQALELLQQLTTNGQKIAILGDMRELGQSAQINHQQIAKLANKVADQVILVGPLMKKYALPEINKNKVISVNTAWEGADMAKKIVNKNDLVLVKGSQNTILLEIVVQALLKNSTDKQFLCRREKFWHIQRENLKKHNFID